MLVAHFERYVVLHKNENRTTITWYSLSNLDPVEPWIDNLSTSRKKACRAILENFCAFCKFSPMDLLDETRGAIQEDERLPFRQQLRNWKDELIRSGKRNSSILTYRRVVLSFLKFHFDRIGKEYGIRSKWGPAISPIFDVLEQEEVKAMVKKARKPLYKAVIGFLAQTGQRTGVLRGITWKMIDEEKVKAYGIASIPMELKDKKGATVREGDFYQFVIGKDAMILLHDWTQTGKRKEQGAFVFGLSERHLHRIVAEAAEDAGVQDDSHGMPGRILYKVRPDAFPTYWNDRVRDSGMDKLQSKYMMGKDVSSEPRNRGLFQTDRLVLAYRKAEPMLDVF